MKPVSRLVQVESATLDKWLRQSIKDRSTRPVKDRLESLLWSWPICRALGVQRPIPAVLTRLTSLAETVYPDTWYPAPHYSSEGTPYESPPYESPWNMHDDTFKKYICSEICKEMRALPGVPVPDPRDDLLWLCTLLEHGWGDGQRAYRQELQEHVVARLTPQTMLRVCKIAEQARDAAYRQVRTDRCLDAYRTDKERARAFKAWLHDAPLHAPFVEEHVPARLAFTAAYRDILRHRKHVTDYVNTYMKHPFEDQGRDRRAKAGRPGRGAWVDPADMALKRLRLSQQERRDLLIAWGLVPVDVT